MKNLESITHTEFWSLSYDNQRMWISQTIELKVPSHPRKKSKGIRKRNYLRNYKLKIVDENGVSLLKDVCKPFYKMITTSLSKSGTTDKPQRNARRGSFTSSISFIHSILV